MLLVLFVDSTQSYKLTMLSNWAFSIAKINMSFLFKKLLRLYAVGFCNQGVL